MHSDSRRLLADWPGAVIVAFALIASGCAGEPESPAKDSATAAFDASVFDAGARATDASSSETDAFDGAPSLDAASLDAAALDSGAADAAESPDIGGADGTASNESDGSSPLPDGALQPEDGLSSDATGAADTQPDPGLVVVPIDPASEVSAVVSQLGSQTATFAAAIEESVLFAGAKGPVLWHPAIEDEIPLKGGVGKLVDVAKFGKVIMLATDTNLYALDGDTAKVSPLAAVIAGGKKNPNVTALEVGGPNADQLWVSTAKGLHLYTAGKVHNVTVKGLSLANARLAWGPEIDGKHALWVTVGAAIAGLVVDGAKIQAWIELDDRPATALAADALGRLWVASDGDALMRDATGSWSGWKLPEPLLDLVTSRKTKEVFLRGNSAFWLYAKDDFHKLSQVPQLVHWGPDDGRAIITTAKYIARLQTTTPPEKPKIQWKKDIAPIYENSCALCHSEKGVNTKLYDAAKWKAKYDILWKLVSSGGMPLKPNDPLTPTELAVIKQWKKDGFLD